MSRIGWALRTMLVTEQGTCLRDRKVSGKLIKKCAPGTELVDWLMNVSPSVHGRQQAAGMWQALLEEGVISHSKYSKCLVVLYKLTNHDYF